MNYASQLVANRHAMAALNLPSRYAVEGAALHALAHHLRTFEASRLNVGKVTSDDHLMQEATRWAKARNTGENDK